MKHLPREHGGTVMILCGALAGWLSEPTFTPSVAAMFVAITAAYFTRDPMGLLLKRPAVPPATRRELWRVMGLWGALGLGATVLLILELPGRELLLLAVFGAPLFGALVFARATRRERKPWAEGVGVLSLALPPLALRFATSRVLDTEAAFIAGACLLFFTGATLHLRALVRDRRVLKMENPPPPSRAWLFSPAAAALGLILLAADLVPLAFGAANALALLRPLVMRGWILKHVMRVGFAETGMTLAFLLLLLLL